MAKTSAKKNFLYQMTYEILAMILPFLTSPYIARVIGAEGLGTYSYSYSVAYYFVLVSMLGIKNYGSRSIAMTRDHEDKMNQTFTDILVLHLLISFVCTAAYIVYMFCVKEDRIYAMIQLIYVLSGLFDISWFYFGIEKFKLTVTRNMVLKILNVISIFVFVRTSNDLWIYCLIMALGALLSSLTLWLPLRKFVKIVKPDWKQMKVHLGPMLVLFIPAIAVSLYKYMDKIMIGFMSNKEQLGFYENAEKAITIPMTIISAFGSVMMPKMANLASNEDKKASERYIALSMEFVMCIAFALSFGLGAVGTVFAPVFWGDGFTVSGSLIMYLSITIPFVAFANVLRTQYLIPNNSDREYMSSVIAGAAINLILNFLLIRYLGAFGATIGTIAAEVTVCLIQAFVVRKKLPLGKYIRSFVLFIPMGIVMFVACYALGAVMGTRIVTLFSQILLGVVIYGVLAMGYFVFTKNKVVMDMLAKVKKRK